MDLKETTDKVIKYKLKYSAQELEDKLDKVDQEYSLEEKEKLNGLENYDDSQIKSDVNTLTENKLDKNQGAENSGKVLGTNANGEVIPLNGYGFEYDEETKMLKYGTDPTSNLNQGIGLDNTLSKKGYAADAGAVGELKEDIVDLESAIGKEETYSEPSGTREIGFYNITRFNTLTANTTYSSITYPVGNSTKAKVTSHTNAVESFASVLFLDDSYNLVSHVLDWNESGAVLYTDELIDIPRNASYIRIVGYTKGGLVNPIAKLNNTTLGTRLDDIESDINKLKEKDTPHKDDVWVCFGDSITGKYTTPCIPDMIAERFGCTVYNVGFAGTRAVKRRSTAYQYFDFQAIADAVVSGDFSLQDENVDETVSSYVERLNTLKSIDFSKVTHAYFFYGTNDFNGSQTIESMKNALIDGISRILTAYPNITPVIITPMFRFKVVDGTVVFLDDSSWVAYEDKTLVSYINGVEEVGNENYIPVINLIKTLGITKYNYTKWFNISDGTHPSEEGIKLVGKAIAEQLYILF